MSDTSEQTEAGPKKKRASSASKPRAARAPKPAVPEGPISIRWNLNELPSSQHKAGLAGLALCVGFLRRRPDAKGVCELEVIDQAGLTLRVDREGMQSLFDDIYGASNEEQERAAPLKNKAKEVIPPKRTVERVVPDAKGKAKEKTFYVYDATVPRGALIADWDPAPPTEPQSWLKLWRDLVWSHLRGVPATREPYESRAHGRASTDAAEAWEALATGPQAGVELPSTYFLGAQARTAENASFRDRVSSQFVLHFWPFVVAIYVPVLVDRDGSRDFKGLALAVPEVADLGQFVDDWPQVVRARSPKISGYRPADSLVDLAGEAGLDVLSRMLAVIRAKQGAAATRYSVSAIDVVHIEKDGNNVRVRSLSRVDPRHDRADAYGRVRAAYWSSVFRRQRIANLLEEREWWREFGRLCAQTPKENTILDSKFQHDCRIAFTEVEMTESRTDEPKTLEQLVYQATRSYVLGRLASKYSLKWADASGSAAGKADFESKKEKVAREAFLAVRSRTGADFVAYFTSTLCSVPQHLGETGYLALARALTNQEEVERVRSLTLLALSANS